MYKDKTKLIFDKYLSGVHFCITTFFIIGAIGIAIFAIAIGVIK